MSGPAHRSVSNIRPSHSASQSSATGVPGSPHTPIRTISSNFASPSTLRAEEDCVIIELGSRYLRAGFAGDALPKAVIGFGPEQQRRAGDYRKWQAGYDADWRKRKGDSAWGEEYTLWKLDLRDVNLGVVADKIERIAREAFTKFLLIDSRPRRMALVLPTALPQPLLSTILDTLFNGFQPPTISLMSAPVLATVAAGLRAALVVDIGWAETVITGIYEYREIHCRRTIRASKLLCREMLNLLGAAVLGLRQTEQDNTKDHDEKEYQKVVSFEECEDVVARVAWCRHSENMSTEPKMPATLPAVKEEEELELSMQGLDISGPSTDSVSIALSSTQPPVTLKLPFSQLSQPCERAFLADGINARDLDDEELPINLLVYQTLLNLPVDVRSVCMSRIIFTGGGSTIPGLKNRILNDVQNLIGERDWNPVQGRAVEHLRQNSKPVSNRPKQGNSGPIELIGTTEDNPQPSSNAAFEDQESDPIDEKLQREASKGKRLTVQGTLRAVDSLGAWSGASLLSQLKIPSVSVVDKEQWLQAGPAGASRQGEESKTNQRQSMGGAGLRAAASDRTSWTLGPWG